MIIGVVGLEKRGERFVRSSRLLELIPGPPKRQEKHLLFQANMSPGKIDVKDLTAAQECKKVEVSLDERLQIRDGAKE